MEKRKKRKNSDTVTIMDVAREAGVSLATVSRAINNSPQVKEATAKKIDAVVKRLNYRPNAIARSLASKKTTTVGIILPSFTHSYYSRIIVGINEVARMYDYNLLITNSDAETSKEETLVEELAAKQVDGIIFMGNHVSKRMEELLSRYGIPVVLAGMIDQADLPQVTIDHESAVRKAVLDLTKRNQKIAFVTGKHPSAVNQARREGFDQALKEAQLKNESSLVFETDYGYKQGKEVATQIMKSSAQAAFVTDDEVAAGLLNGLLDAGVKVPEDFEIITSNNTIVTNYTRPNLTTIDQPLYDVGAVSMRLLTKLMKREELEDKRVLLPHRLAIKKSTRS